MAKKSALVALLALTPLLAHAHTGVDVVHDFSHGLTHPLFGLDHLLAMIAVGLWAVQLGGRALWAVPTSFVGVMILGSMLGFAGIPLPMVETGILTSVLLLGVLITFAVKVPLWASSALVAIFAVFHGYAHGAECPANSMSLLFGAGFVLATASLHLVGIGAGKLVGSTTKDWALRACGAAVLVGGILLA